ncbi:Hypothetical protein, putative [Bodo saltans]|uniref:Receptor-type protein kinase n=1 Tax=Bodo saltans TaxID=75058 RepID=A0A0S4J6J5_BODSA|nr:Hypothetical protein, putative [Bodo saltans]|eukprot:CUG68167.1 Hypothetical protein, putative [Bodo saltans]
MADVRCESRQISCQRRRLASQQHRLSLHRLARLIIGGRNLSNIGINYVCSPFRAQLEVLDLRGCSMSAAGPNSCIPKIAALSSLKELYVSTIVADKELLLLAQLSRLETLVVSGSWVNREKITDKGMTTIADSFRHLRRLELNASTLTGVDNYIAKHLSSLTRLNLSQCALVTDASLASLSYLTELRELNLSVNHRVTGSFLKNLCHTVRYLDTLYLSSTCMNDESVAHLLPFRRLSSLSLDCCAGVTVAGLLLLAQLRNLRKLSCVSVHCLNDDVLAAYSQNLESLETISLTYCISVTNAGIIQLLLSLRVLEFIDISGLGHITDEALEPIESYRASPRIVEICADFSGISEECSARLKLMEIEVYQCC